MSLLKVGIDASRGIGDAYFHQTMREGNRDANLGLNRVFSFVTQYSLIENTFSKINEVLQGIQFASISPILFPIKYSISLCIPLSFTLAKQSINSTNYPNIHTVITTLDNRVLPNVILVTNLVASVALIAFGNSVYGSANLLFLIVNLMHENSWMNTDCIQKNDAFHCLLDTCILIKYLHSLLINHSLNPFYIWMLGDTISQVVNYIRKPTDSKIALLALQEYKSKYPESTAIQYRLNEYHLLKDPISNYPLEDLISQFDHYTSLLKGYLKQDLSRYESKLLKTFHNDNHWIKNYNNPIDYMNNGINSFVNSIRISHNTEFKNKSLAIIRYVFTLPKDEQIDLITNLAITGHYCPERLYSDTKLLYDTYIDTLESRELSNKIIGILHQERLQIVDQMLALINEIKSLSKSTQNSNASEPTSNQFSNLLSTILFSIIPPMEDIHFANCMKNILCPYLYAYHKSVDTLTQINTKKLDWLLLNWAFQKNGVIPVIESLFLQQYNPEMVLERIRNIITNEPTIKDNEIQEWFIEQYISNYSKTTRKEAAKWVYEEVYVMDDDNIPRIKPYYILFFLVNQGVLKIEDNLPLDTIPKKAIDIINILAPTRMFKSEIPTATEG